MYGVKAELCEFLTSPHTQVSRITYAATNLHPRYSLDRSVGGPQTRSGHCDEERNCALSRIESRSSNPSLVTIMIDLSGILMRYI
jgi:hypothetical protein